MAAGGFTAGDVVERWGVPTKGTLRGLPIYEVPTDAVWDARNVWVRRGRLEPRLGFVEHSATLLDSRPIGAIDAVNAAAGAYQSDAFQVDAFQEGTGLVATNILVATLAKIWSFRSGTWIDITDTALGATVARQARFTAIDINNVLWVLHTNGVDVPRKWNGADPTVSVMTGWPEFTDWTIIGDRVIGIEPPYRIKWGETLDINTAPIATSVRSLADTSDRLIAIRALGTLRGAIYKERSLWVVTFQGGPSASAFVPVLRGFFAGPASPGAVVDLDGFHAYMTDTGRIGFFDGFTHQWVADSIKPIMDETIDLDNTHTIHGVYDPLERVVYFYYPRIGDSGEPKGLITLILPQPENGIEAPIAFAGELRWGVSAALSLLEGSSRVLAFRSTFGAQRSLLVAGKNDNGGGIGTPDEISGFWQTGLRPAPGPADPYRITAIETYALRGPGFGSITLKPVFSFLLDDEGGTVQEAYPITVDLETVKPKDPQGTNVRGNFFGLRYEFKTPVTLAWQGARLAATRRE